jgi:hypothetical protein
MRRILLLIDGKNELNKISVTLFFSDFHLPENKYPGSDIPPSFRCRKSACLINGYGNWSFS